MSVGGYDGMHLIYEALKKTGGKADGDSLIAAMKGMKWESPRGPISIDPETRDIIQNIYIRKVEKKNGQLYNVEFATFEAVKDPVKGGGEEIVRQPAARGANRRALFAMAPSTASPICRRASCPFSEGEPISQRNMLTILFDGIAYGMLLFVLASGLAVTLGLMNFVNLAHGAFAMAGGYVTVVLVNRLGVPFPRVPAARLPGERDPRIILERTLYVHVYRKSPTSTRCCSPSGSSSCRWPRSTTSWARARSLCKFRASCRASSMSSASASAAIGS